VLIDFSGGNLFIAVCLVTLVSIIIGMGSSTTGSYIILAVSAPLRPCASTTVRIRGLAIRLGFLRYLLFEILRLLSSIRGQVHPSSRQAGLRTTRQ
jgi:hypothetical protein